MAAGLAGVNGLVGNVPRATVNNEGWFHRDEDGKGIAVCLGEDERSEEGQRKGRKEKRPKI